MAEPVKTMDEKTDRQQMRTGYEIEWVAMCLGWIAAVGLIVLSVAISFSMVEVLVSSVAILSFALMVVAIVDARNTERVKIHDQRIKESEAERAKAEAEAEDKKCETALNNHGRSDSIMKTAVLIAGQVAGRTDFKNSGENELESKNKSETIPSDG